MKLLAFDTSFQACSAAVWADGAIAAHERRLGDRGHAESLVPMLERVRLACGLAYADFDALAVTVGPGTFTGLRIALATARGLRIALRRPVVPVATMAAVAVAARPANAELPVLVAMDARRGALYVQEFDRHGVALAAPAVVPLERAASAVPAGALVLAGTAAEAVAAAAEARNDLILAPGRDQPGYGQPDARAVAAIAVAVASELPPGAGEPPHALYLRAPDARLPA
jgi:tRNA threonylcarbamoyladenosine biosynthesis protein TsaB